MMKRVLSLLIVCSLVLSRGAVALSQEPLNYNQDARQARINELKTIYKISLSDTERLAVEGSCKTAQNNLRTIGTTLSETTVARRATYLTAIYDLKLIQARLTLSQIDTSNLDLLIVGLQQKERSFENASENYALTIEDATALDCVVAPEDFRAALEGVRAARKRLVLVTRDMKEVAKSTLKTTTDTFVDRLESQEVSHE